MCKVTFENSRKLKFDNNNDNDGDDESNWHFSRKTHKIAYQEVCKFVSDNIIKKRESFFLDYLITLYMKNLPDEMQEYMHQYAYRLESRLLDSFPKKLAIVTMENKKVVKPYDGILLRTDLFKMEENDILDRAALIIRTEISNLNTTKLPDKLTANDLIGGECANIPQSLTRFHSQLLSGKNTRRKRSNITNRLVKSFSEDCVYAVTKGKIKTSKHICLGLTIKSLTNSKKMVNTLHKYGHCCSYTTLEELETEATFNSCLRTDICPEDISRTENKCTGLAFNNFDRFVDTANGKDTLHDTVGIIFQNVDCLLQSSFTTDDRETVNTEEPSESAKKKRRAFDEISTELESYPKKPKISENLQPLDNPLRSIVPNNLISLQHINFTWILSHFLNIPNTPMWIGFNSLIFKDMSPTQKISYLTTINLSPTSTSVVLETMKQSQKVALECNEKYMQVTYDLAITKVALQIQATEKPRFDNLFIHVGTFHVMMAFFKAVGKFIENCGITNFMVSAELLASGSVNSFISGKHFNRCKRLHTYLSASLQILHFESFAKLNDVSFTDEMMFYLLHFTEEKTLIPSLQNEALIQLFENYEIYKTETLEGKHGKTAQFYMIYVNLIDYYFMLNTSIRTSDFELFKFVLPKLANLFFILNFQNYSRYLVKYHDNLITIDESHPGLKEELEKGSFGIKRTEKPFSRQPIDLTLEQTINADAANKLTGVSHMTNSISARQRWCKSHSLRSTIIAHVMEETGMRKRQDVTTDLQKNRIKKSSEQIKNFTEIIKTNFNPFANDIDRHSLFNMSTGQAVPEEIENFLLNIEQNGNAQREQFIEECTQDKDRFERAIKKNKILNFTHALQKKKITVSGKVIEVRMQRDLFGQLLCISLNKTLNIEKVLSYPLMPVPLSMCHLDGSICKTDKSVLLKILEKQTTNETPENTDVIVFDGFFMFHLMKDVPQRYGKISQKMLQMCITNNAATIIIAFDRYVFPSIKDHEHNLRGMRQAKCQIEGPDQVRQSDFASELKNVNFKEALVNFITRDWANDYMAPLIGNKEIYINFEKCYKYKVINNHVERTDVLSLACPAHEEADTKIVFHICKINFDANVTIRCSDTDVAIIMLGNMEHLQHKLNISMQVGVGNHQRFINITKLYENLGPKLSAALPGYHALTGNFT